MSHLLSSFNSQGYVSYQTQKQLIDNLTPQDIVDALKYLDLSMAHVAVVHQKEQILMKY